MQPAFKVAEENAYSLDSLFICEIFQALFLYLAGTDTVLTLLFCVKVEFFQFRTQPEQLELPFAMPMASATQWAFL